MRFMQQWNCEAIFASIPCRIECKRGRVMVICLFTERPQWLQHRSAVAGLPTLLEKPSGFAISPVKISIGWCSGVKDVHWA